MRLRAASLALLLSANAALADRIAIPGVPSFGGSGGVVYLKGLGGGGGGGGPSYTPFTSPACYNGSYITNISIPGVGVGRGVIWFAAALAFDGSVQRNFSAITLGGQAPTGEIAQQFAGGMWWYDNTAGTIPGTTATLAFTLANGNEVVCVSSGLVSGASSPTPTIFAAGGNSGVAQPFTLLPVTVAAGGFGISVVVIDPYATPNALPLVWTVATRDAGTEASAMAADNSTALIGSAHQTASGTPTVACVGITCNFFGYAAMAAAWR